MIPSNFASYTNLNVFALIMAYLLFQAILYVLPMGHVIKGPPTPPNGARLEYRISGKLVLTSIFILLKNYKKCMYCYFS